ncbi:MAG TPA: trypsin-like peptidase domain-containing protein [Vicinamibacterales bacterium]|nr:trypsin-like peptidase domain-containing protein [Vicinamibacterales bacterium]
MSGRKSTFFYGVLIALASLVVGMVIASRLDLTPRSLAGTVSVPASNSAPLTGPIDATTFRTIAHNAGPAVVSIVIESTRPTRSFSDFFGLPDQFSGRNRGGQGQAQGEETVQGAGSGFIFDAKGGYILTNNHVVEGAKRIEVYLDTMNEQLEPSGLAAKVVGRDELTDTAVIQLAELPKQALTEAKFGDSDQLAQGDWVMAIGNPFALSNTVTVGVVSAVGRDTPGAVQGRPQQMIQTDAAINKGNSGGPLLNIRGEVVGINTQIVTDQGQGNLGIGFAIPINLVRDILPGLREGKVVRGVLGVGVLPRPITSDLATSYGLPNNDGAVVASVTAGAAADRAGIKRDDVITKFNGKGVKDNRSLVDMVMRTAPGTTVPVEIYRNKKAMTLNVKVDELNLAQEQETVAGGGSNGARPNGPRNPRNEPKDTAFGMQLRDITPAIARDLGLPANRTGAVISSVEPAGSAFRAGLATGDVIVGIDGNPVASVEQAGAILDKIPAGQSVRVIYLRDGQEGLAVMRKR